MIYLILAILCGSLFSIIFKLCQRHGIDGLQVTMFNYVLAFVFTFVPIAARCAFDGGVNAPDFRLRASSWLLASVQGLFFLSGFIIMDRSTRRSGVALTTACARASLVLPVVLSWLLLSQPAPKWLSVLLMIVALVMIVGPFGPESSLRRVADRAPKRGTTMLVLLGVFIVFGLSDFFMKVVQQSVENGGTGNPEAVESQLSALTCVIFLMASLFSLAVCLLSGSFRRNKLSWKTVLWGAFLGIANIGCTSCMLRGLGAIPTGIFYPLYNAGIVLVATLSGLLFFGERLGWVQAGGLALAVVAIALSF